MNHIKTILWGNFEGIRLTGTAEFVLRIVQKIMQNGEYYAKVKYIPE